MSSSYKVVSQYAPWRKDIAWWVVLIQGLIFQRASVCLRLIAEDSAGITLVYLLGMYALLHSFWVIFSSLRHPLSRVRRCSLLERASACWQVSCWCSTHT